MVMCNLHHMSCFMQNWCGSLSFLFLSYAACICVYVCILTYKCLYVYVHILNSIVDCTGVLSYLFTYMIAQKDISTYLLDCHILYCLSCMFVCCISSKYELLELNKSVYLSDRVLRFKNSRFRPEEYLFQL